MKKLIYVILAVVGLGFISCVPGSVNPVKTINYSVPTIINENIDIGLFSPFEVPLVQGREYEFTATTGYDYVFVCFDIEDENTKDIKEKWISIRRLEAHIFSQNLKIPKNAKRAKLGISKDKNHNDFTPYAIYNIIKLEEFIDVVKDEETRRETENIDISKEDLPPAAEGYTKIVIDHKFSSKYQEPLKCGETYIFEIGPFDSAYCIFNTMSGDNVSWLPFEKNGSENFKIVYQIPIDAEEFRILLASSQNTFSESLVSFYLEGTTTTQKTAEVKEGKNIVITSTAMGTQNVLVEDETIYEMTVGPFSLNYDFCFVDMIDINEESIDYFILEKSEDMYKTNCLYIPEGTKTLKVSLTNDYFRPSYNIAEFYVSDIDVDEPFVIGKDFKTSDKYKTDAPDERIIDYLSSIDARKLGRNNPDVLIELCCNKVQELALDDFEMMKLVHDVIWYLASYDFDTLNAGGYDDWDYKTILSKNLCVCAGYSRLYTHFCQQLGIRSIFVVGTALEGNEYSVKQVENWNHAWSMIEIEGAWYLSDLTWDCSQTLNGIRDSYYSCDHFFVNPKEFIKRHYPRNTEEQLLVNPYSAKDVLDLIK